MTNLLYQNLTYKLRGIAFDIYKQFRNRHKERVYHNAFLLALKYQNIPFETEKRVPIIYAAKRIGTYTPDLVVDDKIIVELKAKPILLKKDIEQFWHYLRGSDYRVGLLINFGGSHGIHIIRRVYDTARPKQRKRE